MKTNTLSIIAHTTKRLEEINHPDALRISKEICEFTNYSQPEIDSIVLRLSQNEPWEYIRGYTDFEGNKIYVNRDTLIPRIETLQILEIFKEFNAVENLIDVGCGSGAIGISLAKRYPYVQISLLDISKGALEVTKRNIIENKVETNTEVKNNDLIHGIKCKPNTVVIANLPYIPTSDYIKLDKSVKDFEPQLALDGGQDGLEIIKVLIEQLLNDNNAIGAIFEIDPSQKELLTQILEKQSKFRHSFTYDFRGLLRFLKLYL